VGRYRLPLLPALAPFAGYYIVWAAERLRAREFRAMLPTGAVAAVLLAAGLWPQGETPEVSGYSYFLLGNAYLHSGRPAAAFPCYERALREAPGFDDAAGMWLEAVKSASPQDVDTLMNLAREPRRETEMLEAIGERLEGLGRLGEAIEVYELATARDENYSPPLFRLARLYATAPGRKDPGRAVVALERLLAIRPDLYARPDYPELAAAIGEGFFEAGDAERARAWWERALAADEKNAQAGAGLRRLDDQR
jgi:tetratricopeptide (TPR) repeat protein